MLLEDDGFVADPCPPEAIRSDPRNQKETLTQNEAGLGVDAARPHGGGRIHHHPRDEIGSFRRQGETW